MRAPKGTGRVQGAALAAGTMALAGVPAAARAQAGAERRAAAEEWLAQAIPARLAEIEFLHVGLGQWLGLLVLVLLASAAAYVAARVLTRLLVRLTSRTPTRWDDELVERLTGPLRFGTAVLLFYLGTYLLSLAGPARELLGSGATALAIVCVTWVVLRLVDVLARVGQIRLTEKDPAAAATLVPMGRRVAKAFVVIVALLSLLQNLGFNVGGLVAGLGVGGLAIALAAQKTIENLFGGVMVIADRPAKVGDLCRVGDLTGTVEEVGLRSTRLRTADRTVVSIPNAEFSTARVENFARRDRIQLQARVQVGYDTSPHQLRWLLVQIQQMLHAHPRLLQDPCRVRFTTLGAYSLDLEILAYVATTDWDDFLEVREDVYLRILDLVAESGTTFAYPSQTLYLGKDAGRDLARTQRTEATVRAWIEKGELLLPRFPPEKVAEIDDTLDYPPAGSATRGSA